MKNDETTMMRVDKKLHKKIKAYAVKNDMKIEEVTTLIIKNFFRGGCKIIK
jgi:hypothetical protein